MFLSYDRDDLSSARKVAAALEVAGHSVWWDRHIRGGALFSKEIEKALAAADVVVVLWSGNSIESPWVRDEAGAGRDSGRLVPVRIEECLPPLGFRQYQSIDLLRGGSKQQIAELSEAIYEIERGTEPRKEAASGQGKPVSRRMVLTALGGTASVAAAAFAYRRFAAGPAKPDPELQSLLDQAWQAWAQGTADGNSQAIGLYRRATVLDPSFADAWGFLGCAYGDRGHNFVPITEREAMWQRAQESGRRALTLDSKNAYGRAAVAYARPLRGNWALMESEFRKAQQDQPGKWLIIYSLALLLGDVGRFAEAASLFASLAGSAPTATQYFFHIQSLWASGQLVEAERILEGALEIFGTSPAIWWQRFDMLLSGGRASAAIAQLEDTGTRPANIDETQLAMARVVARALANHGAVELQSAERLLREGVVANSLSASRSLQYASVIGSTQLSMELARTYFLPAEVTALGTANAAAQAAQIPPDDRRPRVLFLPTATMLRAHPDFKRLLDDLGLENYWQQSKSVPDFRRTRG